MELAHEVTSLSAGGGDSLADVSGYVEVLRDVVDTSSGAYQVTFENPDHPIKGSHLFPEQINVDLTFYIQDAFGWQDSPATGHSDGVFDISLDPSVCEQPRYMGIQGFSMQMY